VISTFSTPQKKQLVALGLFKLRDASEWLNPINIDLPSAQAVSVVSVSFQFHFTVHNHRILKQFVSLLLYVCLSTEIKYT